MPAFEPRGRPEFISPPRHRLRLVRRGANHRIVISSKARNLLLVRTTKADFSPDTAGFEMTTPFFGGYVDQALARTPGQNASGRRASAGVCYFLPQNSLAR